MPETRSLYARVRPREETLLWGGLVVCTELLLVLLYFAATDAALAGPAGIRYVLYPFVWINVGAWAVLRTTPAPSGDRQRWAALAISVAYFGVLAYAGGVVGQGYVAHGHGHQHATSLRLLLLDAPPGWSPGLVYFGQYVHLTLLPFKLVGYLALSYLVYATVLDAAGSAVTGALGLLSCVSCTWPVLASLVTGVFGSGTAIAGAVYAQSYGLSTVVFVVTVGLLYWRPFGR
ncbi:hypothetical protein BRC83_08170 [Halobacteriales archaeon QS_1_68_17]|nr:MAG: hypothetical protein BRC83_08170 [Halobacteriales archaeon QS_1_68_17]